MKIGKKQVFIALVILMTRSNVLGAKIAEFSVLAAELKLLKEAVLARYRKIRDAIPMRKENQAVSGWANLTTQRANNEEESMIRENSAQYTERIFLPKRIIAIEAFLTPSGGKIDR